MSLSELTKNRPMLIYSRDTLIAFNRKERMAELQSDSAGWSIA